MLDGRWRAKVERGLAPVGKGLQRAGITADSLTLVGLACAIATAILIGAGELRWAVLGVVASGATDILDGSVARHSGKASPRGAFLDSVVDRVADAVMFGGVAWYLVGQGRDAVILAFAVGALSMVISYERARAEALGFEARGGILERAERMLLLGIGLAFHVLVPVLWVMLALGTVTAAQRFVKVWRQASDRPEPRSRRLRRVRHRHDALGELATGDEGRGLSAWWEARRPGSGAERRRPARRRTRP